MKDFLLLFRGGLDFASATQEQLQKAMMRWKTWMEELVQQGKYSGGHRLSRSGSVLRRGEKITDGPYAESKEIVGGYVSLKAKDLTDAIETAKGCPIFNYNGSVEVREVATT